MIDFLKTYVEQIICIAIFVVIIELILPKGNMKKYVYSITSIIIILFIISPIISSNSEFNIRGAIDNVAQTISKAAVDNTSKSQAVNFNDFKDLVITTDLKEKIQEDITERFKGIGLEVAGVEIDVDDKYQFDEISIAINSLHTEENKSINKASEAISLIADVYKIDNSKITITELGGN